jgi:legumain
MLGWDFYYMCSFVAVFAVTAADPHESSYACYYDSTRQTYLGDVFSVMWMEDSDKVWLLLQKLFYIVKFVGLVFKHSL